MSTANAFRPLTKGDIAEVLGVSTRTVENWINDGALPTPRKLGNRVYWHPDTFYGWLERCLTAGEADSLPDFQAPSAALVGLPRPGAVPKSKAGKRELDVLRSRDQTKLDAIVSGL